MGFFTPAFFAGLLALGLPVWLHLLRQHKTTPQPFASLMFFEARTQSSVKHRRLKYLLLFALRMLLLALLALAFASPYILSKEAGIGRKSSVRVIAIDHSFSMRQGGRLEEAKRQALELARSQGASDRTQVYSFGSSVHVLREPTRDPAAIRAAIQAVQPTDERSSFAELSRALRGAAQDLRAPVEAHVFSDFQKSSWPPNFADAQLGENVKLVAHPIVKTAVKNFAVEQVNAPARLYDPKKVRVQVTVAGYGTEKATRRVALVINGKEQESKQVEITPGGRATVEFFALEGSYGLNKGEARISPGDDFPDDDAFYFAVERTEPRKVLFLTETRANRAALYFRTAIESASDAAFSMEALSADQAAQLPLEKYACVVLSDVGAIPASLVENLKRYVERGGALWAALGRISASRGSVPVSGQTVKEARYSSREGERFRMVASLDPGHPSTRRAPHWEGVKFYSTVALDPAGSRVIARLSDDSPLLVEKQVGEGRVLVFTSALDNLANDFPLHASFVPFVLETVRYLARMEDTSSSAIVGAYYELRATTGQGAAVEVLDPQGKRVLTLAEAAKTRGVTLGQRGYFDVRRPSGYHELVAVNPDRKESDLEVLSGETLTLWQNTGREGSASAANPDRPERPVSLWWFVMLAALAVVLAEAWVGNRHLMAQERV